MSQLKAYSHTRQIAGEPKRQWFSSRDLDFIVWVDESERPFAFQLCYEKRRRERALTWESGRGFTHAAVDSGEQRTLHHKGTPTLTETPDFDRDQVMKVFSAASHELPAPLVQLVILVLAAYPGEPQLNELQDVLGSRN